MSIGPIQLLMVGFESPDFKGEILEELKTLQEHDVVRLVDMLVVRKDNEGNVETVLASALSTEEAEEFGAYIGALIGIGVAGEEGAEAGALAGALEGADGHVLDEEQVWYLVDEIPEGSAAGIALLEHRWAIPLREAIERAGGTLLTDAWIHPQDLVAIGLLAGAEADARAKEG